MVRFGFFFFFFFWELVISDKLDRHVCMSGNEMATKLQFVRKDGVCKGGLSGNSS